MSATTLRSLVILVFLTSLTTALLGCNSEASTLAEERSRTGSPVDLLVVSSQDFTDTFRVLGTAEPIESVQLSAEVPGRILRAFFEEGDRIERNQIAFRVDVEVDQAGIDVLETQLEAAQRELRRLEALRSEGLATAQQLDSARTEVASLESNLRQLRLGISRDVVRSPISGYLSTRMADPGEYANPGAPLAEVIDYDTIVVHAQVPESELRFIEGQEEIEVYFPALNQTRQGTIHRIALRVTHTSRNFPVEIRVENSDHRIRPGMRARLHFNRLSYEEIILLPRDAILEGFQGREAMVVEETEEGLLARVRTVTLGPGSSENVVVTEGLRHGDRVILRGHRGLVDRALVDVISEHHQHGEEEL